MEKLLLTVAEAQEALSIGRTKVYELLKSGAIPSMRIGRCIRIPAKALEIWLAGKCGPTGDGKDAH